MAEENVTVLARIKARDDTVEQVYQQALSLVEPTRAEAGCISYDLHQNADDKCSFMFYETWAGKDALDKHIQTPHLQAFIARAGELLAEPLDVTIWKKIS